MDGITVLGWFIGIVGLFLWPCSVILIQQVVRLGPQRAVLNATVITIGVITTGGWAITCGYLQRFVPRELWVIVFPVSLLILLVILQRGSKIVTRDAIDNGKGVLFRWATRICGCEIRGVTEENK
jgi:hypothetical protein